MAPKGATKRSAAMHAFQQEYAAWKRSGPLDPEGRRGGKFPPRQPTWSEIDAAAAGGNGAEGAES